MFAILCSLYIFYIVSLYNLKSKRDLCVNSTRIEFIEIRDSAKYTVYVYNLCIEGNETWVDRAVHSALINLQGEGRSEPKVPLGTNSERNLLLFV